jgi:hypothetical protein
LRVGGRILCRKNKWIGFRVVLARSFRVFDHRAMQTQGIAEKKSLKNIQFWKGREVK